MFRRVRFQGIVILLTVGVAATAGVNCPATADETTPASSLDSAMAKPPHAATDASVAQDNEKPGPTESSGNSGELPPLATADKEHLAILKQPLTAVSLTRSLRAETTHPGEDGKPVLLNVPANVAADVYKQFETVQDTSAPPVVGHPNRNLYRVCHNPLYFEDPNLERCGRGHGVCTEAVSALRLAGRTAMLPYMMGSEPPCSRVQALPDCPSCRQFGCETCLPQFNLHGLAAEEFVVLGLIFLIP